MKLYANVLGAVLVAVIASTGGYARAGFQRQGFQRQGMDLGGFSSGGKEVLVSFPYSGLTLGGAPLVNVRIVKGEIVAERSSTASTATRLDTRTVTKTSTLTAGPLTVQRVRRLSLTQTLVRGADLAGAQLVGKLDTGSGTETTMAFRIVSVTPEDTKYEPDTLPPGAKGGTYLYNLQYLHPQKGWQPACEADADGRRVALPVAAVWDRSGKRNGSTTRFMLSCGTGAITKCYRWGYRPWYVASDTDPNLFRRAHWSCTRMARADYCGDGFSRTQNGTQIFVFDNLVPQIAPPPTGGIPTTITFETGWSTCGAVCLSRFRWSNWPAVCPPTNPCLYTVVQTVTGSVVKKNVCDTPQEAQAFKDPQGRLLRMFNLGDQQTMFK